MEADQIEETNRTLWSKDLLEIIDLLIAWRSPRTLQELAVALRLCSRADAIDEYFPQSLRRQPRWHDSEAKKGARSLSTWLTCQIDEKEVRVSRIPPAYRSSRPRLISEMPQARRTVLEALADRQWHQLTRLLDVVYVRSRNRHRIATVVAGYLAVEDLFAEGLLKARKTQKKNTDALELDLCLNPIIIEIQARQVAGSSPKLALITAEGKKTAQTKSCSAEQECPLNRN